jgi:hypothetical protein
VSEPNAAPAADAPAKAGPSVIRRLEGTEESSHDRLMKKHVPAWVVSGAVHVTVIALAILIFGNRGPSSNASDKIVSSNVEKEPDQPKENLENEDIGLDSNIASALPDIERVEKQTVDFAVTADPIGVPDSTADDMNAMKLPGMVADAKDAGNPGDTGNVAMGGGAGGQVAAGFNGRSGSTKSRLLSAGGGNPNSERAVERGLAWLARQQKQDGGWVFDGSDKDETAAATGICLLPFLAAGHTHRSGKYQKVVDSGLKWLIRNMQSGGKFIGAKNMYAQAIATIPLCEAYGMTKDKGFLLAPAQSAINYIQKAQGNNGSWGYQANTTGDTSIVGWQIQALKAAQLSKDIVVDDKVVKAAMKFLDDVSGGSRKATYGYTSGPGAPGTALTAVGLLCRYYSSGWGPNNAGMIEGVEGLSKRGPLFGRPLGDMYYYYYATQVVHFYGDDKWKDWNEGPLTNGKRTGGMRDWLVNLQIVKEGPNHGSWDPDGGFMGRHCGRLGTTAMCILTLEVYYRHLPLYKRDNNNAVKALEGAK